MDDWPGGADGEGTNDLPCLPMEKAVAIEVYSRTGIYKPHDANRIGMDQA